MNLTEQCGNIELDTKREFERACREFDLCIRENENDKAQYWKTRAHAFAHVLREGFGLIPSWDSETKRTSYRLHAWKTEAAYGE